MTRDDLIARHRGYVDCLNGRDWGALGAFVHPRVSRDGEPLGLAGYRAMLERDVDQIPDLRFVVGLLACDPPLVACRLDFDCAPRATFLGLPVDGRRVRFAENVFYRYEGGLIERVWSVIDKPAIEAQLQAAPAPARRKPDGA